MFLSRHLSHTYKSQNVFKKIIILNYSGRFRKIFFFFALGVQYLLCLLTMLNVSSHNTPIRLKRSHTEFSFFGYTSNTGHLKTSHLNLLDCKVPLLSEI